MKQVTKLGCQAVSWVESAGLLVVAIATVIAIGQEVMVMVNAGVVTLADLLLLFIYLEILAMVSIYLKSGKLPVRMPLYIAIVALARFLILDMKNMDTMQMLGVAGAALVLAMAVLVIRYGHSRYPYDDTEERK